MLRKIVLIILLVSVVSAINWTKLNDLFIEAINQRAFPGATVIIANQTSIIYRKNFGHLGYDFQVQGVKVTNETKYDVASITKVMATTLSIMNLVGSNRIKFTDLISKWFKNYDTNKKGNTTIANLLLHNSGLSYDYPGPLPQTTNQVLEYIKFSKPNFPVGTKFSYSNLGFLILGQIVAKVSSLTFLQYFQQCKIIATLKDTNFNPPESQWYRIAPTQYDSEVRKRIIRGQAHERLSYFFGGVTGHSGLFTTANDLMRFMRIMLGKGKVPEEAPRVLPESIVNQFTTRIEGLSYDNKRAYGFDTNCPGTKMKNCFGHDGSTGIMAWADSEFKVAFVVMDNRGHPNVNNNIFDSFKGRIADTIMEALGH